MARGFSTGYTAGAATGAAGGGGGAGGVRRDAEVEAAQRVVSGGGNVTEAIARVQNAGGGELKVNQEGLKDVIALLPRPVMSGPNGAIVMNTGILSGDPTKGKLVMFGKDGKELKMDRTVTVMVAENGVSGARMVSSNGTLQPIRNKAEITPEQQAAILTANLPPQLKNARFNQQGQINGWKIPEDAIEDKAARAAMYKHMGRDGVLRVYPNSPAAAKLQAAVGGNLTNAGLMQDLFKLPAGNA